MDQDLENEQGNINPSTIHDKLKSNLKKDVIKQIISSSFDNSKTKIGSEAVMMVSEILKSMCTEACLRAANLAVRDGSSNIDIEHLEKCLPQLMLDFP